MSIRVKVPAPKTYTPTCHAIRFSTFEHKHVCQATLGHANDHECPCGHRWGRIDSGPIAANEAAPVRGILIALPVSLVLWAVVVLSVWAAVSSR